MARVYQGLIKAQPVMKEKKSILRYCEHLISLIAIDFLGCLDPKSLFFSGHSVIHMIHKMKEED